MTALQIQLPETLYQKAVEVAQSQHLSIDMMMAASLAQWLAFRGAPNAQPDKPLRKS